MMMREFFWDIESIVRASVSLEISDRFEELSE